jgi:membrane-associated phospholipid phosphatase
MERRPGDETRSSAGRARPTFDHPILTVTGYSFPSGHAMIATLLYGFLAVFL